MKKFIIILAAVVLLISLTGCGADSLESYRKASEKTDSIKMGQTSVEYTLAMDFDTTGMTEEQIKNLNYIKNMKGSSNAAFDNEAHKGIYRSYLNMGGLGFDFDLYMNGSEMFIKLPVVGKYMRLDGLNAAAEKTEAKESEFISGETQSAISSTWLGLIRQEDVFKGKDIILSTPDGEVKTTQYTIALNDGQIKELVKKCSDLLSKDEKLKASYEKYIRDNIKEMKGTTFEKFFADINGNMDLYKVESFKYDAFVDVDGYIVNETVQVAAKLENVKPGNMTGLNYRLDIKNWDINKKQSFEFPVLTEGNTLKSGNAEEGIPFMLEGIFEEKEQAGE